MRAQARDEPATRNSRPVPGLGRPGGLSEANKGVAIGHRRSLCATSFSRAEASRSGGVDGGHRPVRSLPVSSASAASAAWWLFKAALRAVPGPNFLEAGQEEPLDRPPDRSQSAAWRTKHALVAPVPTCAPAPRPPLHEGACPRLGCVACILHRHGWLATGSPATVALGLVAQVVGVGRGEFAGLDVLPVHPNEMRQPDTAKKRAPKGALISKLSGEGRVRPISCDDQ